MANRRWSVDFRSAVLLTAAVWGFGHGLDLLFQAAAGLPALKSLQDDLPLYVAQFLLSLAIYPVIVWGEQRTPLLRWSTVIGAVVLLAIAASAAVLANVIARGYIDPTTATDHVKLRAWLGQSLIVPIYIYIIGFNAVVLIFARSMRQLANQRGRVVAAEREAAQAQLLALRLQVNPHFLFNSLNAISSLLVTRRPNEAEEAIGRLSEFLRASLANDPNTTVCLEEELAATEAYFAIEAIRFEDRMRVEIACDDALLDCAVPSLILQPLAENAVKYGVSRSSRPTTISLTARRSDGFLHIALRDDATPDDGAPPVGGTGIGLVNVRRRLDMIYGEQGTLTTKRGNPGFVATIRIPSDQCLERMS